MIFSVVNSVAKSSTLKVHYQAPSMTPSILVTDSLGLIDQC